MECIKKYVVQAVACNLSLSKITIIAPYNSQVNLLKNMLDNYLKPIPSEELSLEQIESNAHLYLDDITTPEKFQGKENTIVLVSLVRSNREGNIGFLNVEERLNVFLSRARNRLILFGNFPTFEQYVRTLPPATMSTMFWVKLIGYLHEMRAIYDFNAKYTIIKQAKSGGSPVTVSYFGNFAKATTADENWLDAEGEHKNIYKFSYFNELMVARKFSNKLSFQLAGTYSHYNIIDSVYGQHDFYGVSFVGKYKFSPQSSIHVDFDYLLNVSDINEDVRPKPNLGIGYEVSTGSHQFQVFVCTGGDIISQDYRVYNTNDFTKGDFLIGFNITRQWGFK